MYRKCYYTYEFSGCVLSEHKVRVAMMDVAVVVTVTMVSGAVIGWSMTRSTIM